MFEYNEETVRGCQEAFIARKPSTADLENEILEVRGTIENEQLILKGCCGSEEYIEHRDNIADQKAYLEWLSALASYPCSGHVCYDRGNYHASCGACQCKGKVFLYGRADHFLQ